MRQVLGLQLVEYSKWAVRVLVTLLPLLILYILYLPSVSIKEKVYINPFIQHEWWTILVGYFIFICVGGVLGFVLVGSYITYRRAWVTMLIPRLTNIYVNIIVEYLYADKYKNVSERRTLIDRVRKIGSQKLRTEAFIKSITKVQEAVAENHSEAFKELIKELNVEKAIVRFLYSYNTSDRILGMRFVSYLRIKEQRYIDQIFKYSKSKNFALRSDAYAALIRMVEGDNKLAEFIGDSHDLSLLDINFIVSAVIKNFKMNIDYHDFLASPMKRKIIVGLLLSKYRYDKERKSLILILNYIGHEEYAINYLAWDAFLNLVPKDEAADIIIDRFFQEQERIQLMILRNVYGIRNDRLYDMLEKAVEKGTIRVKLEAMRILFKEQFNRISMFYASDDLEIKVVLKEVADIHISV
ncbi:hypothetical protein [Carboxylicivirga sp. M1479]|uniref:hypothetical protein n=1 Tax=Carboxylicivirga sp. M1479 TaxID=2594476 RepID=UPI00117806C6|nr:hypothetical protein [Carboxylicivirga sp. M1479]TRX62374.1 hypothetical protein FNN09_19665 [Carboxylicivirga sp. M1479]